VFSPSFSTNDSDVFVILNLQNTFMFFYYLSIILLLTYFFTNIPTYEAFNDDVQGHRSVGVLQVSFVRSHLLN